LNHPSELFAQLGQLGLVLLSGLYYGALPATLVMARHPEDVGRTVEDFNWILNEIVSWPVR
jgi:hypothetical protein